MRVIRERVWIATLLALASCGGGGSSSVPADPAPENDVLVLGDPLPGVTVTIDSVDGGTGPLGRLRPGDRPVVRFRLEKNGARPWGLGEMDFGAAMVSGPTSSYQRVIVEQQDVVARASKRSDGSYVYAFATPIPDVYQAPYNDTPSFDADDDERTGQPLLDGTYTVAITLAWRYTLDGAPKVESGEDAFDFRVGGSATFVPRRVTAQANCDACHVALAAHEGLHHDVRVCVLCHTAGAEDANDPAIASGTPGVSISSKVMFHKIHSGKHLAQVLGITTLPNGLRDYLAPPRPYELVDGVTGLHDYSRVGFPVWPNRSIPMPKNFGFDLLAPEAQALDVEWRKGVTTCRVCHGDPDGAGPLVAPEQGDTVYAQHQRQTCGACHDDVVWESTYDHGNFDVMPAQTSDGLCRECHFPVDDFVPTISAQSAHEHPLDNPRLNPFLGQGLKLQLLSVAEANGDGDGTFDPGERVELTLRIVDDAGLPVAPSTLSGFTAVLSGPTWNANLVHETDVPTSLLAGAAPFTFRLPERLQLELVGRSTAAAGETFTTARAPHANATGALTQVFVRTATGFAAATSADSRATQNYLDVDDASGFARDDLVVIDDGVAGLEEYLRVQFVEANRLWFSSPHTSTYPSGLRNAHASGATVSAVTLVQRTQGVHYALDAATGTITELVEFGAGAAVIASYTSDFVIPDRYPESANGSPDLGELAGKWAGKPIVDGTYRLVLSATKDFDYFAPGITTPYRASSPPASAELLVGSATTIQPYSGIDSGTACNACHQELYYHEKNYRGFDACIACHGNAGAEDVPRYVAANAPPTTSTTVSFRTLIHQIHGSSNLLAPAATVTESSAPYPDNFGTRGFTDIVFPAMPGRSAECAKCHGPNNTAWKSPTPRDHPAGQSVPTQIWTPVCAACHDTPAAITHIATTTFPDGTETCAACHEQGMILPVDLAHQVR